MRHTLTTTATALALTGLAAFGLTGCDRGGNSGASSNGSGTTIIQTIAQTPGSSTTPSATAITDGKALCRQALIRVQELINATDPYWKIATNPNGASLSDEKVSAAADHVTDVAGKVIPALQGMIGPGSPENIANPVKDFIDSANKFTKAIGDRAPDEEVSPLAKDYGNKIDEVNHACGY